MNIFIQQGVSIQKERQQKNLELLSLSVTTEIILDGIELPFQIKASYPKNIIQVNLAKLCPLQLSHAVYFLFLEEK